MRGTSNSRSELGFGRQPKETRLVARLAAQRRVRRTHRFDRIALLVPLAGSSAGSYRDSTAALGGRVATAGFGVKPRENEEGRGGAAAPRSGGESPAGLSANGTRRRVIAEIIGWGFRGRYCPIDGSGPFVCDKATRPGKISPSLGQS